MSNLDQPALPASPPKRLALRRREAAEALGISIAHLQREIAAGRIAVCRSRGRVLIPKAEIEDYLSRNLSERAR